MQDQRIGSSVVGAPSVLDDRSNPLYDRSLYVSVGRRLHVRIVARYLQRMISTSDDVKRWRGNETGKHRAQLRRRAEIVPAPLNEEHRPGDRGQMCSAQLREPARGMKRIPE